MKIRDAFLVAVLLLFNGAQTSQNGASLNSLIQELSPIARLTNGIAIQTELSKDSNKMNELVAEFLGVGSGDDVARLKQLKVDEVAKELGELYATVEKVPELNVDMAALANSFNALETMKQASALLGNKNLTDPSDELEKAIADAKTVYLGSFTNFNQFKDAVTQLKFIKNTNVDSLPGDVLTNNLIPLKTSIGNVVTQLILLKRYKQELGNVFKLEGMSDQLKEFTEISSISKLFEDNFNTFSSMAATLGKLENGVNHLKPVLAKDKALTGLAKDLGNSSAFVKKLMTAPSALRLTIGFSGGIDYLKLMLEDLKKPTVKKLISGGKDTKGLEEALNSVASLHSTFHSLQKVWSEVAQSKKLDASGDLATVLASMFGNSYKTIDATKLADSLGSIGQCFEDLTRPAGGIDYTEVSRLIKYATDLGERIKVLRSFMEQHKLDFEALHSKLSPLSNNLMSIQSGMTIPVIQDLIKTVRTSIDIDSVIDSLNRIRGESKKVQAQNPYVTLSEKIELHVISKVLGSLNRTNVKEMLDCFQKNYELSLMDSTLKFAKSFQVIKKKKTKVESVREFLADLAQVKTGLLEIQKMTSSSQKPKLRRRRAPNSKSLENLKNAETVAIDFGRGVQVLREFTKILENEASVKVAVEADDDLKKAISAIPGVQSVWTDDNRKGMGKMVVDLNDLDKFSGTLKKDNMTSLWTVFAEAGKIRGVEIDAKLFDDPISKALFSSFHWDIYSSHLAFHSLKDLKLNFTQHQEHLKAASLTLDPLQKFFDDFFDIDRSVKEEEGLSTLLIVIIVCGSIVGVVLLGLMVKYLIGRYQRN